MRYFLIAVAIGASLLLGGLGVSLLLRPYGYTPPEIFIFALGMGVSAVGLMNRRVWGAYVLCVAAFGSVPVLAFWLLLAASTWRTQPSTSSQDFLVRILFGTLAFAVTVGVLAVQLGRQMRREGSVPPA